MKRGSVATGAVMLVTAALLGYCQARTTQLDAAFNKVKIEDTERDVVARMGAHIKFSTAVAITASRLSDVLWNTFTSLLGLSLMRLGRFPSTRTGS